MTTDEISDILKSLEFNKGTYEREAVDAALARGDEIVPHLISILDKVLSNPSEYAEKESYIAHIYSLILLGHFKEHGAHKRIVDLFSLPGELADELFGDLITETLPYLLFRTCDGSLELTRSLVLNRDVDAFCRGSAMKAMVMAVADGLASRSEVIGFLGGLFTGSEADIGSDFWNKAASCVCDLYPEEHMDVIEDAYERGLIRPFYIQFHEFEEALKYGPEQCLERVRSKVRERSIDDVHRYMSWWACFREKEGEPARSYRSDLPLQKPKKSKERQKKKRKRKKARASRKRNR